MSRKLTSGFTLIELMVVVLIIGVMVGLAATRLDFVAPKYRLRGAARDVAAVMRQGKSRAAAQGKDVYFEADLSQGRYWLLVPFPKEEPGDLRPVESRPLEYQPLFVRSLPEGVQFVEAILGDKEKANNGRIRVRLSAFGASSHVIFNMANTDHATISVKMNGFTGLVSFYDERQTADELLEDRGT